MVCWVSHRKGCQQHHRTSDGVRCDAVHTDDVNIWSLKSVSSFLDSLPETDERQVAEAHSYALQVQQEREKVRLAAKRVRVVQAWQALASHCAPSKNVKAPAKPRQAVESTPAVLVKLSSQRLTPKNSVSKRTIVKPNKSLAGCQFLGQAQSRSKCLFQVPAWSLTLFSDSRLAQISTSHRDYR